jgi:hypothetical protein
MKLRLSRSPKLTPNCGTYGVIRAAETWGSTAVGRRSMVRMGPVLRAPIGLRLPRPRDVDWNVKLRPSGLTSFVELPTRPVDIPPVGYTT